MSTLAIALARIAVLEARLDALEGGRQSDNGSGAGSGRAPTNGAALADHQLDKSWADKKITKDPKGWKGRTQVNRLYSQAPAEWLDSMAGLYEWKAQKGREEVPVRLRNDGKPWHENDSFEAKLLRAWANRARSRPAPAPKPAPPPPADPGGPDDFNFGFNVGASPASEPDDDLGF